MKATVLSYQGNIARVNSPIGVFEGIWASCSPIELRSYHFELACDDVLTRQSIVMSTSTAPHIMNSMEGIIINAYIENIEDGVLFLRIGSSLMMLDAYNDEYFLKYLGHYVAITLSHIKLYEA